ncbi:MAG TPA: TonB-dependent receptor [Gemmatimonadales bacterium]|nr:TonB-dependent receptor [Gemmatimonadales bacterium]
MNRAQLLCCLSLTLATRPLVSQSPVTLPELQVTATRIATAPADVPAAVTVLQGDDLRDRGISYLLDALRLVPSASVVQLGSYGAVTSLFMRGGESDYTKVLVDGVVVNEPGGAINLATLSLEDVDRIEIVRGPTSVLYGADAVSGVVQIFTRQGAGPVRGAVEATAGSFGGRDTRGSVAGSAGAFSASLSGARFRSDGIYAFNSGFANSNGTATLGWRGLAGTRVIATARYSDAVGRFPTDGNGDPVDADQRTLVGDLMLGVQAFHPVGRRLDLTADGWSHRLDSRFRDGRDGPADTTGFAFAGTRDALSSRRGATLRADWRVQPALTVVAGVGTERESEDQQSVTESNFGFGAAADSATFQADRTTRSAFVQLLATPVHRIDLQLGGRVDDNSAFGTFATVRIGAVAHLAPDTRLWSAVGTGFKAPTFSELRANSPYEVGNPALRPEQSVSAEVGIELSHRTARVGLTLFSQTFTDFVQYIAAPPGEPTYANLGAARARGLEASLVVPTVLGLTIDAHLTWLSTAVTDSGAVSSETFALGQRLLRRPAVSGAVTARGTVRAIQWSATARWVGSRDDVNFRDFPATRTRLPSYGLLDAAVIAPLPVGATPRLDLVLRGENLFDADWDAAIGFPGRGRTVFGGARLTF